MLLLNDTLYSQYPARWTGGTGVYSNSLVAVYQVDRRANKNICDIGPAATSGMAFFTMASAMRLTNASTNWTAQVASNVCTIDTIVSHNLVVNQRATIAGATYWADPSRLGAGINATFVVTSTPTTHSFTFAYALADCGPFTETAAAATMSPSTIPNVTGWPLGYSGTYALMQPQGGGGIAVTGGRIAGSATASASGALGTYGIPSPVTAPATVVAGINGVGQIPVSGVPITISATVTAAIWATGTVPASGVPVSAPATITANIMATGIIPASGVLISSTTSVSAGIKATGVIGSSATATTSVVSSVSAVGVVGTSIASATTVVAGMAGALSMAASVTAATSVASALHGLGHIASGVAAGTSVTVSARAIGVIATHVSAPVTVVVNAIGGLVAGCTITASPSISANARGKGIISTAVTSAAAMTASGALGTYTDASIAAPTTVSAAVWASAFVGSTVAAPASVTASIAGGMYIASTITVPASTVVAPIHAIGNLAITISIPALPTAIDNAYAVWGALAGDGALTTAQMLRIVAAVLAGKSSGGPDTPVFRNLDDSKDVVTGVADSNGDRTVAIYNP